jgi:hypothetical protein
MKPPHDPKPLTRRDFLRRSAVGLAAPLLLDLSCGQKALTLPGDTGDSGAYPELAFPELASPDTRDSATASDPGPHDPGQTQDPGSPDTAKDPGATDPGPVVVASGDVLFGLFGKAEAATAEEAFRKALSHLDFSWLVPGDTVFVKLSCNSGNPHPAVTSPAAVRAMVAELYARGAG